MVSAEKLLKTVADSSRFGSYNDALSFMVDSVNKKYSSRMLSDDELSLVAGGIKMTSELLDLDRGPKE